MGDSVFSQHRERTSSLEVCVEKKIPSELFPSSRGGGNIPVFAQVWENARLDFAVKGRARAQLL